VVTTNNESGANKELRENRNEIDRLCVGVDQVDVVVPDELSELDNAPKVSQA